MNILHPILNIEELAVKRGGVAVLDIPALAIENGEVLSLIGPNGAGKSSLLLALAFLIRAERGSVSFKGVQIARGNGILGYRRKIAMVFQEPLLFDTTVYHNVATGLNIRNLRRADIYRTVMTTLDRFGIGHLAKRDARKLSGGEAQRTSLARAFALEPEIVFLDEPFSSLDPPTRESLIDDLQVILKHTRTTTVMATHERAEALRLSDRIAVMQEGRIVQIDSPEKVVNHPADEFVASFVGTETILSGEVAGTGAGMLSISVAGGQIYAVGSLEKGERVLCCIRPEQVTLSLSPPEASVSARNAFVARITRIVPLGLFHRVVLDSGFPLTAYVTSPSLASLALQEGSTVYASFKATAVHLIRKK